MAIITQLADMAAAVRNAYGLSGSLVQVWQTNDTLNSDASGSLPEVTASLATTLLFRQEDPNATDRIFAEQLHKEISQVLIRDNVSSTAEISSYDILKHDALEYRIIGSYYVEERRERRFLVEHSDKSEEVSS